MESPPAPCHGEGPTGEGPSPTHHNMYRQHPSGLAGAAGSTHLGMNWQRQQQVLPPNSSSVCQTWHNKRRRMAPLPQQDQHTQDASARQPLCPAGGPPAADAAGCVGVGVSQWAGRPQAGPAAAAFAGADLWGDDDDDGHEQEQQQLAHSGQPEHAQHCWQQQGGGQAHDEGEWWLQEPPGGDAGWGGGTEAGCTTDEGDEGGDGGRGSAAMTAAASLHHDLARGAGAGPTDGAAAGQWEGGADICIHAEDVDAAADSDGGEDQLGGPHEDETEDEELAIADFDVSREEVISRIEQLTLSLVAAAADGQLPALSCVSTAAHNVRMAAPQPQPPTQGHGASVAGAAASSAAAACRGPGRAPGSGTASATGSGRDHAAQGGSLPDPEEEGYGAGTGQDSWQQQLATADEAAEADEGEVTEGGAGGGGGSRVVRLGSRMCSRTLTANNGTQAASIVRVLQLLDSVHALLRSGRTATQRDVYYSLVGRTGFSRPRDVTSSIQSALGLLRVPRAALGISAAAKGAVAGCLLLRPRPGEPWVDCRSVGTSGRPIPGEVGAVDALAFRPVGSPRFVLVVEKDAVFQGLVEARLWEQAPCILITGRGMPDVASRAFLAALSEASRGWGGTSTQPGSSAGAALGAGGSGLLGPGLPVAVSGITMGSTSQPAGRGQQQQLGTCFASQPGPGFLSQQQQQQPWPMVAPSTHWQQQQQRLPVLGLVDWNPGGVAILLAYKCGSAALGLEAACYAVPSLAWLGVTADMLQEGGVPRERCHALTLRDRASLPRLHARLAAAGCGPGWGQQLEAMAAGGCKADIEALGLEELLRQLRRRVLVRQYVA